MMEAVKRHKSQDEIQGLYPRDVRQFWPSSPEKSKLLGSTEWHPLMTVFPTEESKLSSATTVGREVPTPTEIARVLPYVMPTILGEFAELTSRIVTLESKIRELKTAKTLSTTNADDIKLNLQRDIFRKLEGLLNSKHNEKVVAISYGGEILVSAETELDVLKRIDELGVDHNSVFIARTGESF